MSTNQNPITAAQISKLIQSLNGVSADAFQTHGVPLFHLLAEYLRQEKPRTPRLVAMRMVLDLSSRPDLGVANVEWVRVIPAQRLSAFSVRPGSQKRMCTTIVRIYPEDVGLMSQGTAPAEVLERALAWGFQLIPPEAFAALVSSCSFGGQVVSGDAMAYLDVSNQGTRNRAVRLINYAHGHGFLTGEAMERRPTQYIPENWSILVASETREVAPRK